jgi:hypothetical protein
MTMLKIFLNKIKYQLLNCIKMNKLKFYCSCAAILLALSILTGCKEEEEVYTKYPTPVWQVNNPEYSVSMTAVAKLPKELTQYAQEDDQLAAFSGNNVRGIGEKINGLYFISIVGTPEDQSNIHFRYYSARNKYLYRSVDLFSFSVDKTYGTVDNPQVIQFSIVK